MPVDRPLDCTFAHVAVRLADRRNLLRCANCGRELWTPHERAVAPCRLPPRGPCLFRSPEAVAERECPSCAGHVRIKLYACPLHALCTIAKPLPEVACCASCLDFAPT